MLIYPFLQATKSFGLLVLIPTFTLGVALLSAQIVSMWMNYAVYRMGGRWLEFPRDKARLAAFLIFSLGLILAEPGYLAAAAPFPVAAMLGWTIWLVLRHLSSASRPGEDRM